jgi:hypothetical protein
MEFKKLLDKKLKRNKFFVTAGTGIVGYFLLRTFPLSLFSKKGSTNGQQVSVKLNPDAVSRENTGAKNVRK